MTHKRSLIVRTTTVAVDVELNQKQAISYSEALEYEELTGLESYDVRKPRSM